MDLKHEHLINLGFECTRVWNEKYGSFDLKYSIDSWDGEVQIYQMFPAPGFTTPNNMVDHFSSIEKLVDACSGQQYSVWVGDFHIKIIYTLDDLYKVIEFLELETKVNAG